MVSVGFAGLPTAFAGCDANSEAVCYSNAFTSPTSPCYGTIRTMVSGFRAGVCSLTFGLVDGARATMSSSQVVMTTVDTAHATLAT